MLFYLLLGKNLKVKHEYKRLVGILDTKYESANLDKLVAKTETLNSNQREEFLIFIFVVLITQLIKPLQDNLFLVEICSSTFNIPLTGT